MRPRQRIALRRSAFTVLGQLVGALIGLALLWGAVVIGLLMVGLSPADVDTVSGYQFVYDQLTTVRSTDVEDGTVRLAVGLGGLALAVVFLLLARAQLPHPQLTRGSVELADAQRGRTVIAPRAVERAIELAALEQPAVEHATGRLGADELALDVTLDRPDDVLDTLRAVRSAARESLERHGLPVSPVHVTLTKLDATQGREVD